MREHDAFLVGSPASIRNEGSNGWVGWQTGQSGTGTSVSGIQLFLALVLVLLFLVLRLLRLLFWIAAGLRNLQTTVVVSGLVK